MPRSKRRVKNRAPRHQTKVNKRHKTRVRMKSRGLHPASKKRRVRAARRARRVK